MDSEGTWTKFGVRAFQILTEKIFPNICSSDGGEFEWVTARDGLVENLKNR